jgi:hypothetical protein
MSNDGKVTTWKDGTVEGTKRIPSTLDDETVMLQNGGVSLSYGWVYSGGEGSEDTITIGKDGRIFSSGRFDNETYPTKLLATSKKVLDAVKMAATHALKDEKNPTKNGIFTEKEAQQFYDLQMKISAYAQNGLTKAEEDQIVNLANNIASGKPVPSSGKLVPTVKFLTR